MKSAVLVLPDDSVYRGSGIGRSGIYTGELVFNTAMMGYPEALTDPSYAGQILVFAYPLIGNYGINPAWYESTKIHPPAIVASEVSSEIANLLQKKGIGGVVGIDTRLLIRKIRTQGTLPVVLGVYESDGSDWVVRVSTKKSYIVNPKGQPTVALIDYGAKNSQITQLINRNLKVVVWPAETQALEIMSCRPAGIILSNGPGDPAQLGFAIKTIQDLLHKNLPIMGICLGHQLLAQALGGQTYKLPFGHRGINQPVQQTTTKKAYITSHNHGYTVDPKSLPKKVEVTFINLNDGTVEGLQHKTKPWFSVQFHPEGGPGPADTLFIFDQFMSLL